MNSQSARPNHTILTKAERNQDLLKIMKRKRHTRESHPTFNDGHNPQWYAVHVSRIQNTKSRVDARDPMCSSMITGGTRRFNRKMATSIKHEKENSILLKHLQIIYTRKNPINEKTQILGQTDQFHNRSRNAKIFGEMFENVRAFQRLQEIKPSSSRAQDSKWFEEQLRYMEQRSRYPLHWRRLASRTEIDAEAQSLHNPRPIVYLDLELEDMITDRIFIELYADICPTTCENFRLLCVRGDYKGCQITRIWPGVFWRCENELQSAFHRPFGCENFRVKHGAAGILSMVSYGPTKTAAEFTISAKPLPDWNGKYVAFGQVVWGLVYLDFITKASNLSVQGRPRLSVVITSCGEIETHEAIGVLRSKLAGSPDEEAKLAKFLECFLPKQAPERRKSNPKKMSDADKQLNERVVERLKQQLVTPGFEDSNSDSSETNYTTTEVDE